ncbi:MAG: tRNA pseudouridine(38-40) synthase TruA [Deltaproteobacteria bacterium]|nr:tRNA pseudouridine(38-40) synthase TruA [Deltaproteobacteria bacterium]
MVRHTYRALIAYDGGAFHGFAKQPVVPTVEDALLRALRTCLPSLPAIQVGGRTDRGVHAVGQVISFYGPERVEPRQLMEAINQEAPEVLMAREVHEVPRRFHAQYSASGRHYVYLLKDEGVLSVQTLDAMLFELVGTRCFTAMARKTDPDKSTVRQLRVARARRVLTEGTPVIRFDFEANSFLRSQVRVMVATAVREASAGASPTRLRELTELADRRLTAHPAPAEGLHLVHVRYAAPNWTHEQTPL